MNSTEGQKTIHWHRKWMWQSKKGGEIHPMKSVKQKTMNCQKEMFVICCSSRAAVTTDKDTADPLVQQ